MIVRLFSCNFITYQHTHTHTFALLLPLFSMLHCARWKKGFHCARRTLPPFSLSRYAIHIRKRGGAIGVRSATIGALTTRLQKGKESNHRSPLAPANQERAFISVRTHRTAHDRTTQPVCECSERARGSFAKRKSTTLPLPEQHTHAVGKYAFGAVRASQFSSAGRFEENAKTTLPLPLLTGRCYSFLLSSSGVILRSSEKKTITSPIIVPSACRAPSAFFRSVRVLFPIANCCIVGRVCCCCC